MERAKGEAADPSTDPLERLARWEIPSVEQHVTARDCMLYALSVGFGSKPLDAGHLKFVYEKDTHFVPSMVLGIAAPGFWFQNPELGVDWVKLLNVTQSIRVFRSVSPPVTVRSSSRVLQVIDKGAGKGALVAWERRLWIAGEAEPFASVLSTVLLRGDGQRERVIAGDAPTHLIGPLPTSPPDLTVSVPTSLNSGLLYRLNGTFNPLHADPAVAASAGFPRPLMPGTASIGIVCAVLIEKLCDFDVAKFKGLGAKLTAPLYPGDVLRFEFWRDGNNLSFRALVPERNIVVVDQGRAILDMGRRA